MNDGKIDDEKIDELEFMLEECKIEYEKLRDQIIAEYDRIKPVFKVITGLKAKRAEILEKQQLLGRIFSESSKKKFEKTPEKKSEKTPEKKSHRTPPRNRTRRIYRSRSAGNRRSLLKKPTRDSDTDSHVSSNVSSNVGSHTGSDSCSLFLGPGPSNPSSTSSTFSSFSSSSSSSQQRKSMIPVLKKHGT